MDTLADQGVFTHQVTISDQEFILNKYWQCGSLEMRGEDMADGARTGGLPAPARSTAAAGGILATSAFV